MNKWLDNQSLITSIIASCLTGSLGFFLRNIYNSIMSNAQSEYSGKWSGEILDEQGEVVKRDEYIIKHNRKNDELRGKIYRLIPVELSYRKWNMIGKVDGNEYIMICFWSVVATHRSRGAIYVRHKKDYIYEGFYLEDHKDGKIDKTPIILKKVDF